MNIVTDAGTFDLGILEATPTIGITDYSRRETDDFGVTTVVKRNFSRTLQLRFSLDTADVDAVEQQIADVRATPVQWVADDRFAWLDFSGFFKDFSIDVQAGAKSLCSLTIEGLAETETSVDDDGSDPAPEAESTLKLLQPATIDDAALVSSTVAEADYPAWDAGTGYAAGTRVIKGHRIYESDVNVSVDQDPETTTGFWTDIGPTNRWAMFDQTLGTFTDATGSIVVVLNVTDVNALALLDVTGATVRVQATHYDRTQPVVADAPLTFLDLPATTGNITVTITGTGAVSVGTLLIGKLVPLGITAESPTAGITDYSRKDTDDFGEVTVVHRSWAKTMGVQAIIRTDALDIVANRIASVRALPSLWIADEGTSSLTIYGFFKDFSISVDVTVSTLSLTIEGLSEASPLTGGLAALLDQLRPKTQWSSDGLGGTGASAWHDTYVDGQDYFMRQSSDNGATWGPAIPAVGISSAQVLLYKRSATTPAVPTVDVSFDFSTGALTGQDNGWTQTLPSSNGQPCWVITANARGHGATDTITPAEWLTPGILVQDGVDGVDGTDGTNGLSSAQVFIYKRAASAPALPSVTATYTFATGVLSGLNNGWTQTVPAADGNPLWVSVAAAVSTGATDTIASTDWPAPVVMAQDGSAAGINNATVYLFKRSATTPAVPSVTTTYTFSTAVLSGADNGWTQTVPTTNGNPLWVTTAEALSGSSTDTIASTEWAAPTVMAQDGTPGSPGSPGTPGVSPYAASLTANSVLVAADYNGATKTGELPKISTLSVKQGTTDVPYASITATLTSSDPSHIAATYNAANGQISLTQADTTGYVDVAISVSGTSIGTKRIAVGRQLDPHPPASQTSAVGTLPSLYVNNVAFHTTPDTGTIILPAVASGQLRATFTGTYFSDWTGSGTQATVLSGKVVYRVAGSGSGWSDFGTAVAGTTAQRSDVDDNFNGDLNIDQTKTGLTAGTLYEVGVVFRKSGGTTGTFGTIGGSYSLAQA